MIAELMSNIQCSCLRNSSSERKKTKKQQQREGRRMDSRGKQKNPLHLNGSKEGILDLLLRFTQSHSTHAQYRQRGTTMFLKTH
jgi:hypothetical protein